MTSSDKDDCDDLCVWTSGSSIYSKPAIDKDASHAVMFDANSHNGGSTDASHHHLSNGYCVKDLLRMKRSIPLHEPYASLVQKRVKLDSLIDPRLTELSKQQRPPVSVAESQSGDGGRCSSFNCQTSFPSYTLTTNGQSDNELPKRFDGIAHMVQTVSPVSGEIRCERPHYSSNLDAVELPSRDFDNSLSFSYSQTSDLTMLKTAPREVTSFADERGTTCRTELRCSNIPQSVSSRCTGFGSDSRGAGQANCLSYGIQSSVCSALDSCSSDVVRKYAESGGECLQSFGYRKWGSSKALNSTIQNPIVIAPIDDDTYLQDSTSINYQTAPLPMGRIAHLSPEMSLNSAFNVQQLPFHEASDAKQHLHIPFYGPENRNGIEKKINSELGIAPPILHRSFSGSRLANGNQQPLGNQCSKIASDVLRGVDIKPEISSKNIFLPDEVRFAGCSLTQKDKGADAARNNECHPTEVGDSSTVKLLSFVRRVDVIKKDVADAEDKSGIVSYSQEEDIIVIESDDELFANLTRSFVNPLKKSRSNHGDDNTADEEWIDDDGDVMPADVNPKGDFKLKSHILAETDELNANKSQSLTLLLGSSSKCVLDESKLYADFVLNKAKLETETCHVKSRSEEKQKSRRSLTADRRSPETQEWQNLDHVLKEVISYKLEEKKLKSSVHHASNSDDDDDDCPVFERLKRQQNQCYSTVNLMPQNASDALMDDKCGEEEDVVLPELDYDSLVVPHVQDPRISPHQQILEFEVDDQDSCEREISNINRMLPDHAKLRKTRQIESRGKKKEKKNRATESKFNYLEDLENSEEILRFYDLNSNIDFTSSTSNSPLKTKAMCSASPRKKQRQQKKDKASVPTTPQKQEEHSVLGRQDVKIAQLLSSDKHLKKALKRRPSSDQKSISRYDELDRGIQQAKLALNERKTVMEREKNAQTTEKSADKAAKIDRRRHTCPETSSVTESADLTSLPRASDQAVPAGEKLSLMTTYLEESVNPLCPLVLSSSNRQTNDAVIAREKSATDTSNVFVDPRKRNAHSLKKSEALNENSKVPSNIHKEKCATLNANDREHCIKVQGSGGKRMLSSSSSFSSAQDKSDDKRRKNKEDSNEKDFRDGAHPKSSGSGGSHDAAKVVSKFESLSNSSCKDDKRKQIDDRVLSGSKRSSSVSLIPEFYKLGLTGEKSSKSTKCVQSPQSTKGDKSSASTNSMSADSCKRRVKMAPQSSTHLSSKSSSTSTSFVRHLSLESKLYNPVPNEIKESSTERSSLSKLNRKTAIRNDRSLKADHGAKKCKFSSGQSGKPKKLILPKQTADESIGVCQVSSSTESVIRSSKANSGKSAKLREGCRTLRCGLKGVKKSDRPKVNMDHSTSSLELDNFLATILRWNTAWIRECETIEEPPPIVNHDKVFPLLDIYDSFSDYTDILQPLMFMELWESMIEDWKEKQKTNMQVFKVFPTFLDISKSRKFMFLHCQGLLTMHDSTNGRHLKESDLVVLNLRSLVIPPTRQGLDPPAIVVKPVFGIVSNVIRHFPSRGAENIAPKIVELQRESSDRSVVITYVIQFLFRNYPIDYSEFLSLELVTNIVPAIRQFFGLLNLHNSPLVSDILCPSRRKVFRLDAGIYSKCLKDCLNQSQRDVIAKITYAVLVPRYPKICLLHGLPGSGKTFTIVGLVEQLLSQNNDLHILLCAPSNAGIDELCRRLINHNNLEKSAGRKPISFVRVGSPSNVHQDIHPYTLKILAKALYEELNIAPGSLLNTLKNLQQKQKEWNEKLEKCAAHTNTNTAHVEYVQAELKQIERRKEMIEKALEKHLSSNDEVKMKKEVLRKANVVCATLNYSGSSQLMKLLHEDGSTHFGCVIVDEACQCTEVDCLIPLQYGSNKLVLVGDPKQLPPAVLSEKAADMNYGQSLFERLSNQLKGTKSSPVLLLETQYRMHPDICRFASEHFYHNRLKTDKNTAKRRLNFPFFPLTIFDLQFTEEEATSSRSEVNLKEAEFIVNLCIYLSTSMRAEKAPKSIGIITLHQGQERQIIDLLNQRCQQPEAIEVGDVETFQGREKDVVIVSSIHPNPAYKMGSSADHRTLNACITRAKYALYAVGNMKGLTTNWDWLELFNYAHRSGRVMAVRSAQDSLSQIRSGCSKS